MNAHANIAAPRHRSSAQRNSHHIVFSTLSLDVGGAERQIAAVAPALAERGWSVSIFCFNRSGELAESVRAAGVEVIEPPIEANGRQTPRPLRAILSTIAAGRLAMVLRRRKPAIAHFFLTEAYLFGAPAAIMSGAPIRIMSRRESNADHPSVSSVRRVEAQLHQRMTAVLANSKRVVDDLKAEGCHNERLGLIYNGVDLVAFDKPIDRQAMRHSLGVADDELAAVMVANLIGYKGHADLLRAMSHVAAASSRKVKLLLVGRDDGCLEELKLQTASLGLAESVAFLGPRSDVDRILLASDIGVHSSHTEGFSNAILESMAAGLPMVVTDVGGNAEAVRDGTQGFVVPAHASETLGAALRLLADDRGLRRRFAVASRKRVEESFSLSSTVERYDALYLGLIAGSMPGNIPEVAISQF